jgi:molybdopterin molybdotransferase
MQAFQKQLSADVLIISGGVSAGDEDFVPAVLEELGVVKIFHRANIKPGKPVWCGKKPGGPIVFALPGNPFACLVTFRLFVEPFLQACSGLPHAAIEMLPLMRSRSKKGTTDDFFPVRISGGAFLEPLPMNGSGDIRLGLGATGIALHPAGRETLSAGESVRYFR